MVARWMTRRWFRFFFAQCFSVFISEGYDRNRFTLFSKNRNGDKLIIAPIRVSDQKIALIPAPAAEVVDNGSLASCGERDFE